MHRRQRDAGHGVGNGDGQIDDGQQDAPSGETLARAQVGQRDAEHGAGHGGPERRHQGHPDGLQHHLVARRAGELARVPIELRPTPPATRVIADQLVITPGKIGQVSKLTGEGCHWLLTWN